MIIRTLLLLATSISITTFAAEHIDAAPLGSLYQQDANRFYEPSQLIKLESENESFYVFHQEYMAAAREGIVILLPDMQTPPLNNSGISFLAKRLSDDGYDTYTLTPPDLSYAPSLLEQDIVLPDAEKPVQKLISPISESNLDEYKMALVSRFEVLYNTLSMTQTEKLVVVAFGNSAGLFGEYLATLPNLRIDAFAVVSPQLPNATRQKHLASNLSLISPALLDVYYSFDNPIVVDNTQDRARWARKNSKLDYRQRELFGEKTDPLQHQRLRKELLGFLRVL
ncbi:MULTISPECIES: DUF3530 family protein [Pseudoalteromonas]|uniref:DUF3530 family protein n=1 Tax=Pseudoalteromonas TaxID=53246 RepID=UPI000FFED3BB|nr:MULTISPECIES: DUF3530 family protein [unclassified Pseudoalteromonas]MCG9758411.1 alpha/beta hydrolase family protein [Pseudoalteromonas sp. Isolate6]RXE84333.1 DUF3530 domain-containing protein [Pseudoalteromonas sp. A757]